MGTILVHVDVETTGPHPWAYDLCSVAMVAHPEHQPADVIAWGYWRVAPPLGGWRWNPSTLAFWQAQPVGVRLEAYEDLSERRALHVVAEAAADWLGRLTRSADEWDLVPVADPGAFDRMWLTYLLAHDPLGREPLHWRTLCLRSAEWGGDTLDWADSRSEAVALSCEPRTPHHPLSDCEAQRVRYGLLHARRLGCLSALYRDRLIAGRCA